MVAHELGHIRNRDILLMLSAGVMAGAIVLLAEGGLRGLWYGGGFANRPRSNARAQSSVVKAPG